MSDINKETRAEGRVINSVEFHKTQSVALVSLLISDIRENLIISCGNETESFLKRSVAV